MRNGKPRTAIWCNNRLCPRLVGKFTDEDICVIAWIWLYGFFKINLTIRQQKFVQPLEFSNSKSIPFIVGSDSNSHSVLLGCWTSRGLSSS